MTTLQQHLTHLPYRDLRGIATRLQVKQPEKYQKQFWIDALHTGWHTPATAQHWLAQLSPAAHTALRCLLPLHQLPLSFCVAQFGHIRRVTHQQRWPTPPWQAPQTAAEELYYSGLLVPGPTARWAKATYVTLPTDLRPLLTAAITSKSKVQSPESVGFSSMLASVPTADSGRKTQDARLWTQDSGLPLLHDLGQLLIYLHGQALLGAPPPCTHQGRWLAPRHLPALNQRLLHPEPTPLPRSHKQTERLRLLFFLAQAAQLLQQATLTPIAWAWLAAAPPQQLAQLGQAWLQAAPDLRTHYQQPDADLPPPWPQPLCQALRTLAGAFTAADLTAQILNADDCLEAGSCTSDLLWYTSP